MKIKVLLKEPGKRPRSVNISNKLDNLQKTVGGYIETVTLAENLAVICNEEGRLHRLPWCCEIGGVDFVGTIILCGVSGDEFADIPLDYQTARRLFPQLWNNEVVGNVHDDPALLEETAVKND